MLENLDLGQKLDKAEYKRRVPELQRRLFELEQAAYRAGAPAMIVFEGWAAAGKGSTINLLAERMDPRGFRVAPITPPRTAELRYPWMRRFWLQVPARGQLVVYDTSWYRRVLIDRVQKNVKRREWQAAYQDILDFEQQLAADGMLIVKFWLHISRQQQRRRFKKLLGDELTAWQVTEEDAAQHRAYGKYAQAVEEMLARTHTPHAPWIVVEAGDRRFTRVKVMETLAQALDTRLRAGEARPAQPAAPAADPAPAPDAAPASAANGQRPAAPEP